MVSLDLVRERLAAHIACSVLEVTDTSSGCGRSFDILIVSEEFNGVPLVQRHRRINELFAEELRTQIHAFTLKTLTPAQAQKK